MGTWNYRVILKDGQYAIHEVYYNHRDSSPVTLTEHNKDRYLA